MPSSSRARTPAPPLRSRPSAACAKSKLPLIAGSGVNAQNAADQLSLVEAAIVGSAMKPHGKAEEPIDEALAAKLMQSVKACR